MTAVFHGSDGVPILKKSPPALDTATAAGLPDLNAAASPAARRLEASRQRLRQAMSPPGRQLALHGDAPGPTWLTRLENLPGLRGIVSALKSWWARHPLRPVVTLAHRTSDALAAPVAERHPIAMVSAGIVLGALLVKVGPWRWGLKRVLFAGLVPQLVSNLPIDTWLGKLRLVEARRARSATPVHSETERAEGESRVVH